MTEGGIRKRYAKTFDLRTDAEWWLAQAKRHGSPDDDPLLRDFLDGWLRGKRGIRESTRRQYADHIALHIAPTLGGFRLSKLRRRHIDDWVSTLERTVSPKTKRPMSPAMVGKVLVTLRAALESAVPRQIPENPARKVEAPKVERRQVQAMTRDGAAGIVRAVQGTWMEYIVRVLLGSGMRIGEATALNQRDVHDGWVQLRESKSTLRAVRLSADADAAIHDAIRKAPRRGPDEPVFFGSRTGDRMRPTTLTQALKREAGITAHALRHGTATLMVAGGVHMRLVAEQLGHANPAMTARVYAHVSPESQMAALGVLDDAVSDR